MASQCRNKPIKPSATFFASGATIESCLGVPQTEIPQSQLEVSGGYHLVKRTLVGDLVPKRVKLFT